MWKTASVGVLIASLSLWAGCRLDSGPVVTPSPATHSGNATVDWTKTTEVDVVEQVERCRQEYRQALEMLVDYYTRSGNNRQLKWAKEELTGLRTMAQYNYIEDVVPDPQLKASVAVPEADTLFTEAKQTYGEVSILVTLRNQGSLRLAIEKYKHLIRDYPSSDKIDDAAYELGTIYEYAFKNYASALTYYQRAYQWDPSTPNPARFRAAYVLDKYMHRKAEALEVYQEALKTEGVRYIGLREDAEKRIHELTRGSEGTGKP